MDLLTAVEKVDISIGVAEEGADELGEQSVPSAADNERALAELSRMLGGIA